ncbi:MAG: ArnT family glycosyltransferase [Candidatus Hodarchaeota archaeon]
MFDLILISTFFSLIIFVDFLVNLDVYFAFITLLFLGYMFSEAFSRKERTFIEKLMISFGSGLLLINITAIFCSLLNFWHIIDILLIGEFFCLVPVVALKRLILKQGGAYTLPNRAELILILFIISFYVVSSLLRHAPFHSRDEYAHLYVIRNLLLNKSFAEDFPIEFGESLWAGETYGRFFFVYTYAALMKFASLDFYSLERISIFFTAMIIPSVYLLATKLSGGDKTKSHWFGAIAAVFIGTNPTIIYFSIRLFPDLLATTLIVPSLFFFASWKESGSREDLLICGFFIFLSLFTKLHGLVFLSIMIFLAILSLKDKKRIAILLGSSFLVFLAILIFGAEIPVLNEITLRLQNVLQRLYENVASMGANIGSMLDHTYGVYGYLGYYPQALFVLFALGGGYMLLLRPKKDIMILFLPLLVYLALFWFGTFGGGVRHFMPCLPLLMIPAAEGALILTKRDWLVPTVIVSVPLFLLVIASLYQVSYLPLFGILPFYSAVVAIAGGALVLSKKLLEGAHLTDTDKKMILSITITILFASSFSIYQSYVFINFGAYSDSFYPDVYIAGNWLKANTTSDVTVLTNGYVPLPYFADYRTARVPPETEQEFLDMIEDGEIDYVIIFTQPILSEFVKFPYLEKYLDLPLPNTVELFRYHNPALTLYGELSFIIWRVAP